ncbi:MAG: transporter substrate-binding domain-containing protein [Salinispira sp.]
MKNFLIITLSLVVLLPLAAGGNSESDTLVVAMELQYPPFETTDTAGNPTGISVDMAQALGEYLDKDVEIRNTAWVGLIPSLQSGEADIVISSMTITEERAQTVDFSIPYAQSGLTLLIAEDSPAQSFSDLNSDGIVIAVKSGTTGAIVAQNDLPNAEIRQLEEVAACILEVAQGKADAFIYDALTVYESHQNHKDTTRINIANIPNTAGYWGAAVKKDNAELLNQVNAFIREYRANGGFSALGEKYLSGIKSVFDSDGIPFFFDIDS